MRPCLRLWDCGIWLLTDLERGVDISTLMKYMLTGHVWPATLMSELWAHVLWGLTVIERLKQAAGSTSVNMSTLLLCCWFLVGWKVSTLMGSATLPQVRLIPLQVMRSERTSKERTCLISVIVSASIHGNHVESELALSCCFAIVLFVQLLVLFVPLTKAKPLT